jgi:DNA-binding transcriptional MerR regulator
MSRRLGVSTHVLRAWELRYGLLRPARSAGGYRLYSEADEERVRTMQAYLACGLSTAEAARAVLGEVSGTAGPAVAEPEAGQGFAAQTGGPAVPRSREVLPAIGAELGRALERFDESAAQTVLDRLLSEFTVETALRDVMLPYLHEVGERWECGEISVGQEHFASNVLRARLAGMARGWGRGHGPRALLACAPGEEHDIPLLAFGVVLHRGGWRISYLGANTPVADVIIAAAMTPPAIVVLSTIAGERFETALPELDHLARAAPLALGGPGATPEIAEVVGARLLAGDVITEARRLS